MRWSTAALIGLLILVGAVAVLGSCDPMWVRRPIIHSEARVAAINAFRTATVVPSELDREANSHRWNQVISFGAPPSNVTVVGRAHMSTIEADYRDGFEPQPVFEYEDYTNNIDVRIDGPTLYVYRSITLLYVEYRLAVFDLAARKPINDFLVAPEDMPPIPDR